ATPGEEASDRSRWVAIGLVATTSSLPGRPWLWNSSASWSVNVGRAQRPSFFEDISTPYKPFGGWPASQRERIERPYLKASQRKPSPGPPAPSCWRRARRVHGGRLSEPIERSRRAG